MAELSQKRIDELKDIWKESYGVELTDQEALEYGNRLVQFVEGAIEIVKKQEARKRKLEEHPKGYHLMGEGCFSCMICDRMIEDEETWYDGLGIKCIPCQRAIEKKVIPRSVCKNDDSWFSTYDLKLKFGLHYQTVMKMIRNGTLKARVIPDENGKPHFYVFLKRENVDLRETL